MSIQQMNNPSVPTISQIEQLIDNYRSAILSLNPNDLQFLVNQNILNQNIIQLEQLKNSLILSSS